MSSDTFVHPFSAQNLFKVTPLCEDDPTAWQGFRLDTCLENNYFTISDTKRTALTELEPAALKLALKDVALPDLISPTHEYTSTSQDSEEVKDDSSDEIAEDDEIWALVDVSRTPRENRLVTWDQFLDTSHHEAPVTYLSEAPPHVYDALLRQRTNSTEEHQLRYARPEAFINALYNVALGRNSVFFSWNESLATFDQKMNNYTLSGLSQEVSLEISRWFATCGSIFRELKFPKHKRSTPTSTALHGAILSCLDALEEYLACLRTQNATILRFRQCWTGPYDLLLALKMIAFPALGGKHEAERLKKVVLALDEAFQHYPYFHHVFQEIAKRLMDIPLRTLSSELGLQPEHVNPTAMNPLHSILSQKSAAMISECLTNLTVLRDNDSKHSLLGVATMMHHNFPSLCMAHRLSDLVKLQQSADNYERRAICPSLIEHPEVDPHDLLVNNAIASEKRRVDSPHDVFQLDLAVYEDATRENLHGIDSLKKVTLQAINQPSLPEAYHLPPFQALEMSITPVLTAQNRLTSYSVIQVVFLEQNLLRHLDLLHRCQLMGDGMFAARLSRALFDPDQATGEGTRHSGYITGLRLHDRDTWPPASSELRLALMGVLSETMSNAGLTNVQESISFSIRELSDNELERCRQVNSIFALDFLRLYYKPPTTAIELMMDNECLDKYDRIFKHLLLLLRMKAVAQSLLLDNIRRENVAKSANQSHRLRLDIFRFVSAVVDYSHNVAISLPWQKLLQKVRKVYHQLVRQDYEGTMSIFGSASQLREQHDAALNEILAALLLKKKQAEVKQSLDDIFTVVLEFSSLCHANSHDLKKDTITLSRKFGSSACEFLGHLRSISGKQQDQDDALIENLLIRLDMYDYYERLARHSVD